MTLEQNLTNFATEVGNDIKDIKTSIPTSVKNIIMTDSEVENILVDKVVEASAPALKRVKRLALLGF
jgi:hypothetical protein